MSDPLTLATHRLDHAASELNRICAASEKLPDEATFATVDAEFWAARETFRRALSQMLGRDTETIERMLGL